MHAERVVLGRDHGPCRVQTRYRRRVNRLVNDHLANHEPVMHRVLERWRHTRIGEQHAEGQRGHGPRDHKGSHTRTAHLLGGVRGLSGRSPRPPQERNDHHEV